MNDTSSSILSTAIAANEKQYYDAVCSIKATQKSNRFMSFCESILNGSPGEITVSKRPPKIASICGFLDLVKIDFSKFKGWADLELLELNGKPSFFVSHCDPIILNSTILAELCNLCLYNQLEYKIYPSWWGEDKICIVLYRLEVEDRLKYSKES